ncbi:MAG: ECF-type sigma factor [Planctomycetota bacterium]
MRVDATELLARASQGDQAAVRQLAPVVYEELRALARRYLPANQPGATLQPTALVHEAFLRLFQQDRVDYQSRTHFLAAAAIAMRSVLADHARASGAAKRGGGWCRITLDNAVAPQPDRDLDLAALDDALARLAGLKERAAKIVELRFFGGMSVDEVAAYLGVSARTVKADWRTARAWLRVELSEARSA